MYELIIDTKVEGADPSQPIHKADAGFTLITTIKSDGTAVDISTASSKVYRFEKPDGTTADVDADFNTDGSDGKLKYVSLIGTYDQNGDWYIQGVITLATKVQYTEKKEFTVFRNLAAP